MYDCCSLEEEKRKKKKKVGKENGFVWWGPEIQ